MTRTEEFLISHDIIFYRNAEGRVIITQSLHLAMSRLDDDMFCNCTIEGRLDLDQVLSIGTRCFNDCTILGYLDLSKIRYIDEYSMKNCYIGDWLVLDNLQIVNKNFLSTCKIQGSLQLNNVEYLPKGFNPDVKYTILLPNLKSKLLKELLFEPGIKRELGFNLLKVN